MARHLYIKIALIVSLSSFWLPVWSLASTDAWEVRAPALWMQVELHLQDFGKMSRFDLNHILGSTNIYLDDEDAMRRPYQYQLDATTRLIINFENGQVVVYSLHREIPNHFKLASAQQIANRNDSSDAGFQNDKTPTSKHKKLKVDSQDLRRNRKFFLIQSRIKGILNMSADEILSILGTADRCVSNTTPSSSLCKQGSKLEELWYNLDGDTKVVFNFVDNIMQSVDFTSLANNIRHNFEVAPTVVDEKNALHSE